MSSIQHIKFACDALPDCQGQIVESIGNFVIIEGLAQDSGAWFAKGVGGARRFGTRQEAADYIEYAMDAKDGGPGSGPTESGRAERAAVHKAGASPIYEDKRAGKEGFRIDMPGHSHKVFKTKAEAEAAAAPLLKKLRG